MAIGSKTQKLLDITQKGEVVKTSFVLNKDLLERFKKTCEDRNLTMGMVINSLIADFLSELSNGNK